MHIFIKPPEDDRQIETCHGGSNNKVNIVIFMILLTLYLIDVLMDLHTLVIQQDVKNQDNV
jgi:hypothetical protein